MLIVTLIGCAALTAALPFAPGRIEPRGAGMLALVPAAARATRQLWASLGLSRTSLPCLVVLGLVLSAVYVPPWA